MSFSAELGNQGQPLIEVVPESEGVDFIYAFATQCFFIGDFPTRDTGRNRWLLDCRAGLGNGQFAGAIANTFLQHARALDIRQFAGSGFGAFFIIGAILALEPGARAGLIRTEPKRYGRERWVEGDLDPARPICIVDDVINSGTSAIQAVRVLRQEGYNPKAHLSIFRFSWGLGVKKLESRAVCCRWLATVQQLSNENPRASNEANG